mmetsp:Transcript_46915/g.89576  ORF Transcript_46915/g.89576 Transcript_46915/m.89576 type:complete len:85 (+) Transcript_46915:367-621(+)
MCPHVYLVPAIALLLHPSIAESPSSSRPSNKVPNSTYLHNMVGGAERDAVQRPPTLHERNTGQHHKSFQNYLATYFLRGMYIKQ